MDKKTFVTKTGIAVFPHLRRPEVFDGKEIGYTIKLMLTPEETEEMKQFLLDELEAVKNLPEFAGKKWSKPSLGMGEDKDGNIIFKFKKVAHFKSRTGTEVTTTLPIFDASGKPLPKEVDPSGGSQVKVAYSVYPFYKTSAIHGLSLRLEAIQVIELKEYGKQDASGFGFGEEKGYVAPDNTGDVPFGVPENDTDDNNGGDADF